MTFKPSIIALDFGSVVNPFECTPYVELGVTSGHERAYSSFKMMWYRLTQKTSKGRYVGVKVDPRWQSFATFLSDMGDRPPGPVSLDRIDPTGPYCKSNCRWASYKTQADNRKITIWVTDGVDTLCLKDMAKKYGLPYKCVHARVRTGWLIDEALSTPVGGRGSNGRIRRLTTGRFRRV